MAGQCSVNVKTILTYDGENAGPVDQLRHDEGDVGQSKHQQRLDLSNRK